MNTLSAWVVSVVFIFVLMVAILPMIAAFLVVLEALKPLLALMLGGLMLLLFTNK